MLQQVSLLLRQKYRQSFVQYLSRTDIRCLAEEEEEEKGEEVEQDCALDEQDSGPDEDEDLNIGGTQFQAAFKLTVSCFVTTL